MAQPPKRATALDFATRTVFDAAPAHGHEQDTAGEITRTLGELIESFGVDQVVASIGELTAVKGAAGTVDDRVLQALRAYSVMILDDDRPKLVAALVGKLAKLDLATGRPLKLQDLGRANGISKQAVSKKLAELATRLNLPRPDSTPASRAAHRLMNKRNYRAHIARNAPALQ